MKKIILCLVMSVLIGAGCVLSVSADAPNALVSKGRFSASDESVIFDYRDFEEINKAIEIGKTNSYNQGYADGLANQPAINAKVTYTYHHHDIGNGDPTEVSFTAEEVENGTKDAWFAAHPVPEKMSSAVGDYTKQNTHVERRITSYIHHDRSPVRTSPSDHWYQSESGSMEWTGSWNAAWDEPVYSNVTVSDGFVPACGYGEGECIRVVIDME